jgi:hypothetical protein
MLPPVLVDTPVVAVDPPLVEVPLLESPVEVVLDLRTTTGIHALRRTISSSNPPTHPWSRGSALNAITVKMRLTNLVLMI